MSRSPRVRCDGCAFEWFGPTSAHGLRIVGTCPRCGGVLDFLVPVEDEPSPALTVSRSPLPAVAEDLRTPAMVLGTPLRH